MTAAPRVLAQGTARAGRGGPDARRPHQIIGETGASTTTAVGTRERSRRPRPGGPSPGRRGRRAGVADPEPGEQGLPDREGQQQDRAAEPDRARQRGQGGHGVADVQETGEPRADLRYGAEVGPETSAGDGTGGASWATGAGTEESRRRRRGRFASSPPPDAGGVRDPSRSRADGSGSSSLASSSVPNSRARARSWRRRTASVRRQG